jgi:Mg2+ and Co2+ transporter CorA
VATEPSNGDRAAAEAFAVQVRASDDGVAWRKVTTLLDHFGAYRLTPRVRGQIASALAEAGLEAKPSIGQVERYETVRLSLREVEAAGDGEERGRSRTASRMLPISDTLRISRWRAGAVPEREQLFAAGAGDGVQWFDVDVIHTEPDVVFEALEPLCPGLTEQMVQDLFTVDPRPHVHSYDDAPTLRFLSAFAVRAEEVEDGPAGADSSKAGALRFQLVEILSGDGWLITCWHRSRRYEGAEEIAEGRPEGHEAVYRSAEHWWRQGGLQTAGDLATLILHELVLSYPSAARVILSWLEQWELDFHRRLDETERHTLIDVRSLLAEFEERLVALERLEADPSDAWFAGLSGDRWPRRVQDLIARSLSDVAAIHSTLRASLDLLGVHSAAQQLRLAQYQARQSERLQGTVALVTSVLLVPTLIAGLFGSNTSIPGEGEWWGFVLMVVCMVGGAALTWQLLRPRQRDP